MPLLITPPEPLLNRASVPVASVYAIIEEVSYLTIEKVIRFRVGYYASEPARAAGSEEVGVPIQVLPRWLTQAATPEEANTVPIFTFLEGVVQADIALRLPPGTTIETVA